MQLRRMKASRLLAVCKSAPDVSLATRVAHWSSLLLLLLLPLISTQLPSVNASSSPCGIYFAPSTIPGAGFGMFAGVDYQAGDEVTPGDLVVPYTDMPWHNGVTDHDQLGFLWDEYSWDDAGFQWMDQEAHSISGASFGIGAAPNCWMPLVNIADTLTDFDQAGLHRSKDPGAGASTPYHNRRGHAATDIPAGMELFVDYGYSYFETRQASYGPTPREDDYELGDGLMEAFFDLTHNVGWSTTSNCDLEQDVCESHLVDENAMNYRKNLFDLIISFKNTFFSPVLATLPQDAQAMEFVAEHGVKYSEYQRSIRTIEWLEENGTCMDNIRAGLSTITQAGRGAFAHRPIATGQVIAPMPLIHADRSFFDMYSPIEEGHPDTESYTPNHERVIHQQLLLNYCFGHRYTNLLLCPYGVNTALVNHSQERANAKIVWSEKSMRRPEWLEQHPTEWIHEMTAGLAFDLVALHPIEQGEEVLIDYGDEWEEAWQHHVAYWKPPPNANSYIPAYQLEDVDMLKTVAEGSYSSEHKDIFCRDEFRIFSGLDKAEYHMLSCRIADRWLAQEGDYRYRAEIVERVEYVEVEDKPDMCTERIQAVLFDVPRDCFYIEDAYYSRDHAAPWSFRHVLGIPDEIFPDSWIDQEEEE